jgi:hypothetical protein
MQRMVASAGYALTRLIETVTVSQPPGKPQFGYVVSRVGQRADSLDGLLRPGRSDSQLPSRVIVSN